MKKVFIILIFFFLSSEFFSETYKINMIFFNIEGKTSESKILQKCPIDNKKIFKDKEEFDSYMLLYKQQLANLRIFDYVDIEQNIINENEHSTNNNNTHLLVDLNITVKESFSFIAVPYFKIDSNSGATIKIKAKDSNFLGTLTPMDLDLNFLIVKANEFVDPNYVLGGSFRYNYPFKLGIINTTLINDYSVTYTFGTKIPEWNGRLGVNLSLPINNTTLSLDLNQYAIRDASLESYKDDIYFTENIMFSIPITLGFNEIMGYIYYSPYSSFTMNWDFDGLNKNNSSLLGPTVIVGHNLSFGRLQWNNNMREGYSFNLSNYISYNIHRNEFNPNFNLTVTSHWNFKDSSNRFLKRLGINLKFYGFIHIPIENNKYYYGEQYGHLLRGIRDEQYFGLNTGSFISEKALSSWTALNLCFDFPISLFTTNFKKSILRHFNFEVQLAPFIDLSLGYNRYTKRLFDIKDGFYTAGVEILVYPLKWQSLTVRGCLGVDMGRFLNIVDTSWRADISLFEFSFGIGLHY